MLSKIIGCESFGELTGFGMDKLAKIRLVAVRRGVWFRVLNRVERGVIDLTLRVTRRIRSRILARVVYSIVKKLLEALESKVIQQMRQIGVPLAEKISLIAQKWGNKNAYEWAGDVGFIQYLTIMNMNS